MYVCNNIQTGTRKCALMHTARARDIWSNERTLCGNMASGLGWVRKVFAVFRFHNYAHNITHKHRPFARSLALGLLLCNIHLCFLLSSSSPERLHYGKSVARGFKQTQLSGERAHRMYDDGDENDDRQQRQRNMDDANPTNHAPHNWFAQYGKREKKHNPNLVAWYTFAELAKRLPAQSAVLLN